MKGRIFEIKEFIYEDENRIKRLSQRRNIETDELIYTGYGLLKVKSQNSENEITHPVEFNIDAESVKEAFEKFDTFAKPAFIEKKEEIRKKHDG